MNKNWDCESPIADIERLRKYAWLKWGPKKEKRHDQIAASLYVALDDFEWQKISPDSFQGVLPVLIYQSLH